jgi:hypothetical protein
MRIPGFSAEMSLGRSEEYEASGNITLDARAQIQPQFCVRHGSTITCTECSDGYCWTHTISMPTLY